MTASLDISRTTTAPSTDTSRTGRPLDWPALAEQLLQEFPDATISDVVRELRRARDGVEQLAVPADEAVHVAALIARNQLNILTGRSTDIARLDPEKHRRLSG
jgi:hypothetical protein